MIYAYCRVSTTHQAHENQQFVIEKYARDNNINVDTWINETISSGRKLSERKLGQLIPQLKSGDILITTEISRLARSLMELMGILQTCLETGCQVWTLKENFRLGTDVQSKVLAFAFGLSAELSKSLLQARVRESLARLKADGKTLGRPVGAKSHELKLTRHHKQLEQMLRRGISKAQIARQLGVHKCTVYNYLKTMDKNVFC